jgi:hypothetical protein
VNRTPVFILAAPYCGASRLAAMLGCHPQISALPELNLFLGDTIDELLETAAIADGLTLHGLLRAIAQLALGRQTDEAVAQARAVLEQHRRQPVSALLQQLQTWAGDRLLLIPDTQAPLRPMDLQRLDRHAPGARCLHLVRHPYTQGLLFYESLRQRLFVPADYLDHFDHGARPPTIDPQIPWLRCNRNLLQWAQQRREDDYMLLTGEELEAAPETALGKVCAWLKLEAANPAAMREYQAWLFWEHGPASAPGGLEIEAYDTVDRKLARAAREQAQLDAPLPWTKTRAQFSPDVRQQAAAFGYR